MQCGCGELYDEALAANLLLRAFKYICVSSCSSHALNEFENSNGRRLLMLFFTSSTTSCQQWQTLQPSRAATRCDCCDGASIWAALMKAYQLLLSLLSQQSFACYCFYCGKVAPGDAATPTALSHKLVNN